MLLVFISRSINLCAQVLGHVARTDISRPRELLSLPNWSELLDVDLDEDAPGDGRVRNTTSINVCNRLLAGVLHINNNNKVTGS